MVRHSPLQQFREAKTIAEEHGCFVLEKNGEYQLYRKTATRAVFLGKRSTPAALRTLVCAVTNLR